MAINGDVVESALYNIKTFLGKLGSPMMKISISRVGVFMTDFIKLFNAVSKLIISIAMLVGACALLVLFSSVTKGS